MTAHPIDLVVVDNHKVVKTDFRTFIRGRTSLVLTTSGEINGLVLVDTINVTFNGNSYAYDGADTTTAHDGVTCLVDGTTPNGRRYKRTSLQMFAGSQISFGNGDVTITHSTDFLQFAGAASGYGFDASIVPSSQFGFYSFWVDAGAGTGPYLSLERNSASPAVNDDIGAIVFKGRSSTAVIRDYGMIRGHIDSPTNAAENGSVLFSVIKAGAVTDIWGYNVSSLFPLSSGTYDLGQTTLQWGNVFLKSTGKLDWNNGNVTLTHSSGALTLAGELFITGSGDFFEALRLISTNANANPGPYIALMRDSASPAASDAIGTVIWKGRDSAANEQDYGYIEVRITDPVSTTEDSNMNLGVVVAGTLTQMLQLTVTGPTAYVNGTTSAVQTAGKQTIYMPAVGMYARTTNGAASGSVELGTNKNMIKSFDFDTTTQEFVQFKVWFPKSWNLGTLTYQIEWSHAATATNFGVAWAVEAVAKSDNDAGDVAFGTAVQVTDTGGTTNNKYLTAESGALTVGGTPAAGDVVEFQIKRVPADAADTMAIDARLEGIRIFYTTNTANDA
jgi:hypothetical protein